jgi:RNA 2',3'-cyclic 3'-phosphodiesterase
MRPRSTKRCFIALPLDEVALADLRDAMEGIEIEGLRLTRHENLHVTLKFLGDVEDREIPRLIDSLGGVAAERPAFELSLTAIGYMPDARRPRVLAATIDRSPQALTLFEGVEEAVSELGFPREGRAYHPHITLGRFRRPPRRIPAPDTFHLAPTTLPVERFVLMSSTLGGAAPEYAELATFPLRGSA